MCADSKSSSPLADVSCSSANTAYWKTLSKAEKSASSSTEVVFVCQLPHQFATEVQIKCAIPKAEIDGHLEILVSNLAVAKRVIKALRRDKKFSILRDEYDNDIIDKETFKSLSVEFACSYRDLSPDEIVRECQRLLELTEEPQLTADEIGDMLDVEPLKVEIALKSRESASGTIKGSVST